jgi:hypothetical protein
MKKYIGILMLVTLILSVTVTTALAGPPDGSTGSGLENDAPQAALSPLSARSPDTHAVRLRVRLYADVEMTDLRYEVVEGHVYRGCAECSPALLYFDASGIYQGEDSSGTRLYRIESGRLAQGNPLEQTIVYTITDTQVIEGDYGGATIYTLDNDRVVAGSSRDGPLVFRADRHLKDSKVAYVLPLLSDRR